MRVYKKIVLASLELSYIPTLLITEKLHKTAWITVDNSGGVRCPDDHVSTMVIEISRDDY